MVACCLLIANCGGSNAIEPSAPATIVGNTGDELGDQERDEDRERDEEATTTTVDGSLPVTSAGDSTDGTSGDDLESLPDDNSPTEIPTEEQAPTGTAGAEITAQNLPTFLPAASAITGATVSEYLTLRELIAQRDRQPPVFRCGAATDPSSLAISSEGLSAGRTFDYDDDVRTATIQLWNYPDEATAAQALAAIRDLQCDSLPIGPLVAGGRTYEQFDSLTSAAGQLTIGAVDEAAGASFERRLDSADGDLVVYEELQFARLGTLLVFAGAREIGAPDVAASPPTSDALRLGMSATVAAAEALGRNTDRAASFTAPIAVSVRGTDAEGREVVATGTYRSITAGFCLVRIERSDGQTAQISWGEAHQAIVSVSPTDKSIDFGEGCGTWTRIEAGTDSIVPPGGVGTLLVGTDLDAGPLLVTSTGDCTIDLLVGFSGAPTDLISSTLLAPGESVEIPVGTEAGVTLSAGCRY